MLLKYMKHRGQTFFPSLERCFLQFELVNLFFYEPMKLM